MQNYHSIKTIGGISATMILDSISYLSGDRVSTIELTYPRMMHSELMTHRLFSRNAASSRAIPLDKMLENCTAMPIYFGMNKSGMQAGDEMPMVDQKWCIKAIEDLREYTLNVVKGLADRKAHKQLFNRYTESFQMMKVLVTATDFDNFLHLRDHEAADPLIQAVARCVSDVLDASRPQILYPGEYHLPYVDVNRYDDMNNIQCFSINIGGGSMGISIEDAIKVSGARSAAISYRNTDYDLEKCQQVYDRLINGDRIHASAVEHPCQAMAEAHKYFDNTLDINMPFEPYTWEEGISHVDREGNLWSGNFKGFIQHRKTIKNECYKKE